MDTGNLRDDVDSERPWKRRRTSLHSYAGHSLSNSADRTTPVLPSLSRPQHIGGKRKPSPDKQRLENGHDPVLDADEANTATGHVAVLRLPSELLQHVFSFLDPYSLGRLLSVNSRFNALIDPKSPLPVPSGLVKGLPIVPQNSLWRLVRSRYWDASLPRPMEGMTELEMWRLLANRSCQFCGRQSVLQHPRMASSPWTSGPGPEGVRAIWPFRVRSCSKCLSSMLLKEEDLGPDHAKFLPGLPIAFFTPSMDYVGHCTLATNNPTAGVDLTKYFFRPQVSNLDSIIALGIGAVEEWFKGLASLTSRIQSEIARYENWEQAQRSRDIVQSCEALPVKTTNAAASSTLGMPALRPPYTLDAPHNGDHFTRTTSRLPGHNFSASSMQASIALVAPPIPNLPMPQHGPAPGQEIRPYSVIEKSTEPDHIRKQKAAKREDIERRCNLLNPPILPSTLAHMSAFQAALQIPMPLNENSWELLRQRLLDQRTEAELKQQELWNVQQRDKMQEEERCRREEQLRVTRQRLERERQEASIPIRDRLKSIATSYIDDHWVNGQAVNKTSCPQFAAEVLTYTRQAFYDVQHSSAGAGIPSGSSYSRKPTNAGPILRLEDMKLLYKDIIKPYADRWGEDLFTCPECINGKRFPFDGVLQHYCSKHTDSLSNGTVVVYWRAAWPEEPPFNPDPVKHLSRRGKNYAEQTLAGPYDPREDEIAAIGGSTWSGLDRIRGMPVSLRVYVTLRQILLQYSRKFVESLKIRYLQDCISKRAELSTLGSSGGLWCKPCKVEGDLRQTCLYRLSDLLNHFADHHLDQDTGTGHPRHDSVWDWRSDLIWLPSESEIRALIHAPGIDYRKLHLIADVLPGVFEDPLPYIEAVPFETFTPRSEQPMITPLSRVSNLAFGRSADLHIGQSPRSSLGIASRATPIENVSERPEPLGRLRSEQRNHSRASYISREELIHYGSLNSHPNQQIIVDHADIRPQQFVMNGHGNVAPADTTSIEYVDDYEYPLPYRYRHSPGPAEAVFRAPQADHPRHLDLVYSGQRHASHLSAQQSHRGEYQTDAERFMDDFDHLLRPGTVPSPYQDTGFPIGPTTHRTVSTGGSSLHSRPLSRRSAHQTRTAVYHTRREVEFGRSAEVNRRMSVEYNEREVPVEPVHPRSPVPRNVYAHPYSPPRSARRVIELAPVSPEQSHTRIFEVDVASPRPSHRRIIEIDTRSPDLPRSRIAEEATSLSRNMPSERYGSNRYMDNSPLPIYDDFVVPTEYYGHEDAYSRPAEHYVYSHPESRRYIRYVRYEDDPLPYEQLAADRRGYNVPPAELPFPSGRAYEEARDRLRYK